MKRVQFILRDYGGRKMKLVKFSSWVTFMFWMLIAIVVAIFLSDIIYATGTDEIAKTFSFRIRWGF